MARKYWTAHVRTAEFDRLRRAGFVVLHPHVDDYVFLEVTKANEKYLERETALGILFLRGRRSRLQTVSEEELQAIQLKTTETIQEGTEVEVVEGPGSKLEGIILRSDGKTAHCALRGYKRTYEIDVPHEQLVAKRKNGNQASPSASTPDRRVADHPRDVEFAGGQILHEGRDPHGAPLRDAPDYPLLPFEDEGG